MRQSQQDTTNGADGEKTVSSLGTKQKRREILAAISVSSIALSGCVGRINNGGDDGGSDEETEGYLVERLGGPLDQPWAVTFFPDASGGLVTESKTGRLLRVDQDNGDHTAISGVPEVEATGQGGLLDVAIHPEYPEETWVYLTYTETNDSGGLTTHLGRGELSPESDSLDGFEVLFVAEPFLDSGVHFGSRVIFGPDGYLYMTTGDRGDKRFGDEADQHVSQMTDNELGVTIRLEPDGSIPGDNPFVDDSNFSDSIYSYGHRNAQGMTVHPETGEIWQSEHGEEDGDEINIIEEGGHYGWPVTHYGCEYGTDVPVGDAPDERDDVVNPVYYWECGSGGFPPAGMTFYDGDVFEEWEGDLFVGNLAGQYLGRFTVSGRNVTEAEPLLTQEGWRIRDITVGPDDYLYIVVDADDVPLIRLVPERS